MRCARCKIRRQPGTLFNCRNCNYPDEDIRDEEEENFDGEEL
jgi:hypothetical protein